ARPSDADSLCGCLAPTTSKQRNRRTFSLDPLLGAPQLRAFYRNGWTNISGTKHPFALPYRTTYSNKVPMIRGHLHLTTALRPGDAAASAPGHASSTHAHCHGIHGRRGAHSPWGLPLG